MKYGLGLPRRTLLRRETISRVAAGAIAAAILENLAYGIYYTKSIGPITIDYKNCRKEYSLTNPLSMPDPEASKKAEEYIQEKQEENDSVGGVIECIVTGMPPGIGEPVFDKLDAALAKAVMSIGAVKGVEIGDGFLAATHTGSENNDPFAYDENKKLIKLTNHAGGILGGISDGSEIILRAAIKPTASIGRPQTTAINLMKYRGTDYRPSRSIIVPRAVVVVESMVAIT